MTAQSMRNPLALVIIAGLALIACNNKAPDKDAILRHPPYASLTDSLEQQGADKAALFFRRAELLSHNNLHDLAAADYGRSWDLKPDETTGVRYVSALTITGQTGKAIQLLADCRKKFPVDPAFAFMQAELYVESNRIRDALGVYDDILRTDSLKDEAWYEKGVMLEKIGDTAGALYALKKAYTIAPVNTYGLELALLYAEHKDVAALTICDAIQRKDSAREMPDPFQIRGIYYSNMGQYKKAIVQFDSCISRDWKFADAYLEKGIALFKQKEYPQALQSFQMTDKVSETDADGYFWAGRCYEEVGNKEMAIINYRQALLIDKTFTEAKDRLKRLE